ncbi:MAG: hypothetical protein ABIH25_02925 [Candidatus Woesearchaeota archaeon]
MKKSLIIIFLVIVVLAIAVFGFNITEKATDTPGEYDEFAQCLTTEGAKLYGSFQCSHCKTQKEMFGNSIQYVNYVECGPLRGPIDSKCIDAGIEAYPSWIINETTYKGTQSLSKLSDLTGCAL